MAESGKSPVERAARLWQGLVVELVFAMTKILGALPSRWVLRTGDFLGDLIATLNAPARRIAYENMTVCFGDLPAPERRRLFHASFRNMVRSVLLLLHLQPMTPERCRRWVDLPEGMRESPEYADIAERGGVIVSGHIGNWEMLLALRVLHQDLPPIVFLAEMAPRATINRVLERLRSHGDLRGALRKGGARVASRVVQDGGIAAMLVDRNVRRSGGGIYAPFFGIAARTTPLPAWLALRNDVPVYPVFCVPHSGDRYRFWFGPDLTQGLEGADEKARTVEILTRINAVLERAVRADPEIWNWTLKRFKSRPKTELGPYPSYSRWDADVGT